MRNSILYSSEVLLLTFM